MRDRAPGGDGGRDRDRRRGGLLPGAERAVRPPVRPGVAGAAAAPTSSGIDNGWHYPMGLSTPAATVAMIARRYMHDYGATSEDFGRVTVADRRHAATNPNAWFYQRPVTLAEHQASRWIVEPLRLLDCCQESDGAVAVVVTSADAGPRPAAAARGDPRRRAGQRPGPVHDDQLLPRRADRAARDGRGGQAAVAAGRDRPARHPDRRAVRPLHPVRAACSWRNSGSARAARPGTSSPDGAIELGGRLPLNPHGGQLGEAYIHGMNGIAEAVRQVRGTAVNQVARRRPGAGHRRHRRPDQRPDPGPGRTGPGALGTS